ncbi:MAG: SPASM domain-containing protein [Flavobacteriales bacterium]|nr:SPASM domain-containing protein [Flavobacteriales bacterium]MCL4856181.1 SPASM domain-containing protein [Flavobacteriales bacterium]
MASSFSDQLTLLSSLTFNRGINVLKIYWSYFWSKLSKNGTITGLPLSITIEPTTACNLGCPECPSGLKQFTRAEGNLKTDFYKKIIDEVKHHAFYLNFYFQGEPYINPNFLEMVSYANTKKIYTATSTNAHFLTTQKAEETVKSGLSRLTISIDGTTQETYESYRKGGDLNKVLEGAKNIIEAKKKLNSKTPYVIFQFLVVQPNEHQLEDAKKLSTQIGVDEIRFKTAQVYDYKNGNPLIPTIEKYARYKKQTDGTYKLKNKMPNECWRMWSSCVITWDGKIVPCCFDKDAKHQLGDLKTHSLKQIWQNTDYVKFRKQLLLNRSAIDICQNCTEGTKVFD